MNRRIKCLKLQGSDFYRYMRWFAEAWENAGGACQVGCSCPVKMRAVLGRLLGFTLAPLFGRMVVPASFRIESSAWPWVYFHEIVPMMWDLWPGDYHAFKRFVRRNRVRTVFCTARQSVAWINANCAGTVAHWIPEGADVASYPQGDKLVMRSVDVLSYGRRMEGLHLALTGAAERKLVCYQVGAGNRFEEMTAALRSAKMSICYPKYDTSPDVAKGVETLTQRYWEAMLSGTLIVGRAPQELIHVCGYNPVIELGDNPVEQIKEILRQIDSYQGLADRNRKCAEEKGGWDGRIKMIREILGEGEGMKECYG